MKKSFWKNPWVQLIIIKKVILAAVLIGGCIGSSQAWSAVDRSGNCVSCQQRGIAPGTNPLEGINIASLINSQFYGQIYRASPIEFPVVGVSEPQQVQEIDEPRLPGSFRPKIGDFNPHFILPWEL